MKRIFFIIALLITNFNLAQNFHDTQGTLEISNSGQAVYTIPIAMPPSLRDVAPVVNLVYVSGQLGGIAGQGWSINSISNISRIATRKDIDGYVDGVDFDNNDMLAFDGLRLILQSGSYWNDGSIYQTEVQSNTKIELKGSGVNRYFIVTAPDGSRSWYGNFGGMNGTDLTAFYIVRFEDTDGNYITYHYNNPWNKSLSISEIKFSSNINGQIPLNSILFNYKLANRVEFAYINGVKHEKVILLDNIEVRTNNQLFRKYQLTHTADSQLGYEKVTQIQEFNGAGEPANPIIFEYNNTQTTIQGSEYLTTYYNNLEFDEIELSGDFDGDGRLDFTTNNKLFTNLFQNTMGGSIINLPFTSDKKRKITATITNENKLNQHNSIVHIENFDNRTEFNYYNISYGSLTNDFTKTIYIDNSIINTTEYAYQFLDEDPYYACGGMPTGCLIPVPGLSTNYLEGDFNGDGISEVLIERYENERVITTETLIETPYGNCQFCSIQQYTTGTAHYILDLNPGASSVLGSQGFHKINNSQVLNSGENVYSGTGSVTRFVADFNGDGKSDILSIDTNKTYKIITFKQLNYSPWNEIEVIGSGTIDTYNYQKQILLGDFNGDGKVDLLLPDSTGGKDQTLWHIYYSNPNPNGGSFFVKESHHIVEYWPDSGTYYNLSNHSSKYYALDTNGDGKSDLVRVWRNYYKPMWTINNHDTQWKVTTYVNNIGNSLVFGNKFTLDYQSPSIHDDSSPDLPIPIVSAYKHMGLNKELLMVRNHHNQLTYVDFTKDVSIDVLLKQVTLSGGNIVNQITYQTMEPPSTLNNSQGSLNDFYSSSNSVNYPNIEIKRMPTNNLVSQLKNTVEGVTRFQDFRYHGYVVNLHGLGAIGFNKVARSTWYQNLNDSKIWSVNEANPNWRGATQRTYTQLINSGESFSFSTTPLNNLPTQYINCTINEFNTGYLNGAYTLTIGKQQTTEFLSGVKNEIEYEYETQYLLPKKTIKRNFLNSQLESTTTTTNEFENNPSGINNTYYIGRPKSSHTLINAYGDTFETSTSFFYTNNRLIKTMKKGNTSAEKYLVEEFEHDTYGNIIKKTISTLGYSTPTIAPRATEYTYDPTGRFVKTVKDVEGLIMTNNAYHSLYGLVLSVTSPFGLSALSEYDNWGKLKKTTDYLGKNINYTYSKTGNEYTTTQVSDDGSSSIVISDALGRIKKSGSINIDGTWSYKNIEYDFLGRKFRESEPYASGAPTLWNTSVFDDFNRVSSTTNATGLTTTITYSNLTVTANDGTKTTSSTKNANGHVISATDPGGTITYTYYANGNLKTSNYQGSILSMEYNEWGAKTKLTDPSAGIYQYTYYPTGETYQEITPKGTTTYKLNNEGKLVEKTIVGDLTNSKTTYTYDSTTKLLTASKFEDYTESIAIDYTYEYDSYKRLWRTVETKPLAEFTRATLFDAFGRPEKELYAAINKANNKQSIKWVKNTYKNGYHWQILDEATQQLLWQLNTVNASGQLTAATLGNGISITNTYDQYGFPTQFKHDKTGANPENIVTLNTTFNPQRGILNNRSNSLFNWNETFQYDNLDRLTQFTNAQGQQSQQYYDDKGRITQNNIGNYKYTNAAKPYQNTSIAVTPEAQTHYQNKPLLNISYNAFKSPVQIEETGIDKIIFTYNDSNDRSSMFYGGLQNDKMLRTFRKHYSAEGSMEIKHNTATGVVEFVTFIGGDGYTAPVVLKSDGTTQNYVYLHRDYQGTILAITNATAQLIEKRLFDAWGELIKVQDGAGNNLAQLTFFDRGYTGHEHLQSVGLIHMNGRLYDPVLHRFLQPDNFVQDPYNTQNYNRYGYVLNNPLKYIDPSGEVITLGTAVLIGALVSATSYTLTALVTDVPFTALGFFEASFMGAISGGVTFGIGEYALTITRLGVRIAFQSLAHGTFQGMMSGGNFWQGFASGALSSLASSLYGGSGYKNAEGNFVSQTRGLNGIIGGSELGMIAFGTIAGGAGAALTKGNFWQGAATGLMVSGLNHAMHQMGSKASSIEDLQRKGFTEEQIKSIYDNYLKPGDVSVDQLIKKIGGPLEQEYNKKGALYNDLQGNTCALRLSYAMNKSGFSVNGDWLGGGGLRYYTSATRMTNNYLNSFGGKYTYSKPNKQSDVAATGIIAQYRSANSVLHVDVAYRGNLGTNHYQNWKTVNWIPFK
ncbi:MAG: VCBS repeat-containing protein [Bacteroidetes bacterium]|nr:VCBS repeat-containing protein [Bacteroidota bacterium]